MSIELELVDWLSRRMPTPPFVVLGVGDDMAIVDPEKARQGDRSRASSPVILLSTDMLLDGVHFDTRTQSYAVIGRKAIACALSDCAAMAARPLAAAVSLALPTTMSLAQATEIYDGMNQLAEAFQTAIVGGDTTSWNQPLVMDVAMTAIPYDGIEPVGRSGARAGDPVCVTGPLGGSLLGGHLTFTPRVAEARMLRQTLGDRLHAMMDISDGLALDLWRMCRASGVGALLDETWLADVVSAAAHRAASLDDQSPLSHALSDGEDFELLIALAPDAIPEFGPSARRTRIEGVDVIQVGVICEQGFHIRNRDGRISPLRPKGYAH